MVFSGFFFSVLVLVVLFFDLSAFCANSILRPYQSVRSVGMGGVRMSTGLYEENFFNNPARVIANPESRFTLLSAMPLDVSRSTADILKTLKSGKYLNAISDATGKNIYGRFQLVFPSYYFASNNERDWAIAFGFIASLQLDAALRKSYNLDVEGILDVGPAFTYGRKFLKNNDLALGVTAHLIGRFGTDPSYGLVDYLRGTQIAISNLEGSGAMIDFDLGGVYSLTQVLHFDVSLAAALQNIMGGSYSNIPLNVFQKKTSPPSQPRSLGLGVAGTRSSLGVLDKTTIAFEITDIGNNIHGSFYRLLHFGGELCFLRIFAIRGGVNQGYWTAGAGLNVSMLSIDVSTYSEELSLNAGGFEDRRYALNINISI